MYRLSVKLLVTAIVFPALPCLWAADKDNKVAGIVTEAKYDGDAWIKIRVDGEEQETKYSYDKSKFDLAKEMHVFVVGRVEIVYKLNGDAREVVSIKKEMPKATGTVTGVVLYNHDWWVEIKPKNGPPEGFATHFQKAKPSKEDVKVLEKGDIVTIQYTTDGKRHRIESLMKVGKEKQAAVATPSTPVSDAPPSPEQLRQAVERSLVFLEKGAADWWYDKPVVAEKDKRPVVVGPRKQKACASCHHVPMGVWSLTEAKNHGFAVNAKVLDEMREWAFPPYVKDPDLRPAVQDKGGRVSLNTIYLSLAAAADPSPDEKTLEAMKKFAAHLIDKQETDGSWTSARTGYEPPIGDVTEVLTMQTLLVLATAQDKGLVDADKWASCRARALEWLRKTELSDRHQGLAMNVLVTQRFGKPEGVQALVKHLLAQQNADGGWSQLKELPSDAMATGQTLYVLARVGVKDQPAAIQRAQGFLVRTQTQEGSWWVTSREKGRQGVASSYYGSGWATLGLIRTMPQGKAESKAAEPEKKP